MVRNVREFLVGLSNSAKQKKKLCIAIFASVVVIAVVISIAVGVSSSGGSDDSNITSFRATAAHLVLTDSCSSTLYPDLCYSTIASVPGMSKKITSQKDVIEQALNITHQVVQQTYSKIKKLFKHKHLTKREKVALNDCLEMIDATLDELQETSEELEKYSTKKSLKEHASDLKTLISSAITNQESCIDGFSHDGADKKVRKELLASEHHVEKMCSNALAMICNMTNTDIANEARLEGRNLKEEEDSVWPHWLSAGDRRLLQSSTVTADVVVAADGSGNFKTVSEAVAAAPQGSSKRYVIRIKAGVYRENVEVPKKKKNIMFLGDGRSNTIITASQNVQDGSTTFKSATVGKLFHFRIFKESFLLIIFNRITFLTSFHS